MTGDDIAGEVGDGGVIKQSRGGGDDRAYRGFVLAGSLRLREEGECAVLFRGETESHGHESLIPKWWQKKTTPLSAGWLRVQVAIEANGIKRPGNP